jgi:hypothetical protein
MPLFNSQIHWRGIGTTVVIELFILLALAFAVVSYVEWSSNAAVTEFVTESSASDSNQSNEPPAQIQSPKGGTGCPLGKRSPPTQLTPLP